MKRISYTPLAFLLFILFALSGCGGAPSSSTGTSGTSSTSSSGGTTTTPVITMVLVDSGTAEATDTISTTNPGQVQINVTLDGAALTGQIVTVSTDANIGSLSRASLLTDEIGAASVGLGVGTESGAGTVTASITYNGTTTTNTLNYQANVIGGGGGGLLPAITISLVDATSGTAVTGISTTNPGELRAVVMLSGTPLENELVKFEATIGATSPTGGTALTDENGVAAVRIEEAGVAGAGTATATLEYDGETLTDSLNFQVSTSGGSSDTVLRMGGGTPFQEGVIGVGLATVSAGGTTSATVSILDENDNPYTIPVDVTFSSGCVEASTASMDQTVTTVNGVATSTYLAQGCVGVDTLSAAVNIGGTNYSASGTLTVQAGAVGSIEFVSADPTSITLKGTGGAGRSETSTVLFRVVDVQGRPVQGQEVSFALNSTLGGMSIDPVTATSDNDGQVRTTVQAGTVSTSVRLTATVDTGSATFESQSDQLVVTTGIPDQDSFDIVANILNPEGGSFSGTEVQITAFVGDRFNNPVPDGTAVTFTTEGGVIDGSCTTTSGSCTVKWTSQDPRPCGNRLGEATVEINSSAGPNTCQAVTPAATNTAVPQAAEGALGQPFAGRATITASAVGEESFTDVNGNGVFDEGDLYTDLPEVWFDEDEDGVRDANEEYLDFNSNGVYDTADGEFNGVLCSRPTSSDCSNNQSLHVRDSLVLTMSESTAFMALAANIEIENSGAATGTLLISDAQNQPIPAQSTVELSVTEGFSLQSSSFTILSTSYNGAIPVSFVVEGKGSASGRSGTLTASVETPLGVSTVQTFSALTELAPQAADVGVTITGPAAQVAQGSNATYTVTVTSAGDLDADSVNLSVDVDSNFDLVSATPDQGSCGISSGDWDCDLGNIATGDSVTVTFVMRVNTTTAIGAGLSVLTSHQATVTTTTSDNNSGNDNASVLTTIIPM